LAWAGATATTTAERREPAPVPSSLRRRISPLGQAALRCAWGLPEASHSRIVMASRHGEFGRTLSILNDIACGDVVSPADFTLSVHHALAGMLSIAQANRQGHTAIAAGEESFGFGLMEAVSSLAEHPSQPVLFVYYEEPLPAPYADFDECPSAPIALALSLASVGNREPFTLMVSPSHDQRTPAPALNFMHFMLTDAQEMVSHGERLQWRWGRYAAA
jgi:hypothetical protein